jgi:hypothetical protein
MFGQKKVIEACASCDRRIGKGQKVCDCGTATHYMDFKERTQHEVDQWRRSRDRRLAG